MRRHQQVMSLSFSVKKHKQVFFADPGVFFFSGSYFSKPVTHGSKGVLEKT